MAWQTKVCCGNQPNSSITYCGNYGNYGKYTVCGSPIKCFRAPEPSVLFIIWTTLQNSCGTTPLSDLKEKKNGNIFEDSTAVEFSDIMRCITLQIIHLSNCNNRFFQVIRLQKKWTRVKWTRTTATRESIKCSLNVFPSMSNGESCVFL